MAVCEIKCGNTFEVKRSVGGHVNCVLRSLGVEAIKQEDVRMCFGILIMIFVYGHGPFLIDVF